MPRYLIERGFDLVQLPVTEIVERNADDGVTWLHSYVSRDRHRSFDVYEAPSPEALRRAAKRNRIGIDSITEVNVLEPYPYEPQP
jgi:Nickel responsive protein SCO4226-like